MCYSIVTFPHDAYFSVISFLGLLHPLMFRVHTDSERLNLIIQKALQRTMQMAHAVKYHHYAPHQQVYMADMHAKQKT